MSFYSTSNFDQFGEKPDFKSYPLVALKQDEICKAGKYTNEKGEEKTIELEKCVTNTVTLDLKHKFKIPRKKSGAGAMELRICTTVGAAYHLVVNEGIKETIVLNFANPVEPGGGFYRGAWTQEESICRCSGLFPSIVTQTEFYTYNFEHMNEELYTDYLIISPNVPVFRDDLLKFLDEPFYMSVITSPAPIAIRYNTVHPNDTKTVGKVLKERIRKIIQACIEGGYKAVVLGAFGCGAFGNSPKEVASIFNHFLVEKKMKDYFDKVVFAIFSPRNNQIIDDFANELHLTPIGGQ
ncbi:TIGR02452 family protein [Histomonas meleagridis]|uniref:TIGR02452 family protein n=1 Tax=Histomonas meleagridis TaxID=135588 RepID=UPI00355ABE06|nr:TIGR02452 family protein [Histomonas meleagridis]KAH0803090.1 TIGR02452 family protein [Histomonas meleagridis]